jgi:hypothetical protein
LNFTPPGIAIWHSAANKKSPAWCRGMNTGCIYHSLLHQFGACSGKSLEIVLMLIFNKFLGNHGSMQELSILALLLYKEGKRRSMLVVQRGTPHAG